MLKKEIMLDGIKYYVRPGTFDEMIIKEVWDLEMYSKYLNDLGPSPTIIDIGAHIGGFALQAAEKYPNSKIFCYEPHPDNFQILNENIFLNNFEDIIHPFKIAISGKKGKGELHIFPGKNTGMHSMLNIFEGDKKIIIDSITLEDIFKSQNIDYCDFLKVDCEGVEEEILLNTPSDTLKNIQYISLEMHFNKTILGIMKRFMTKYLGVNRIFNYLKKNNFNREHYVANIYNFVHIEV